MHDFAACIHTDLFLILVYKSKFIKKLVVVWYFLSNWHFLSYQWLHCTPTHTSCSPICFVLSELSYISCDFGLCSVFSCHNRTVSVLHMQEHCWRVARMTSTLLSGSGRSQSSFSHLIQDIGVMSFKWVAVVAST